MAFNWKGEFPSTFNWKGTVDSDLTWKGAVVWRKRNFNAPTAIKWSDAPTTYRRFPIHSVICTIINARTGVQVPIGTVLNARFYFTYGDSFQNDDITITVDETGFKTNKNLPLNTGHYITYLDYKNYSTAQIILMDADIVFTSVTRTTVVANAGSQVVLGSALYYLKTGEGASLGTTIAPNNTVYKAIKYGGSEDISYYAEADLPISE